MEQDLKKQIVTAMKAKDSVRVMTLKMLASSLHNAQIDKRGELTSEDELAVVKKEAKKRTDAIDAYKKAGATDRVEAETAELAILKEYLPEEMGDAELETIVMQTLSELAVSSPAEMGRAIGAVMAKVSGKADGKRVAELVKAKIA